MKHGISEGGSEGGGEGGELGLLEVSPKAEVVQVDSGGWISGPMLPPGFEPEDIPLKEYGLNIVAFMADYPEFVILGGKGGRGWTAYTRGERSRAVGPGTDAASLDEMARYLNAIRRRESGV